ncbi:MAG: hypothetical protein IKS44_05610, partial [Bacteroidales bacterium]|nr:hypothetical protein [Bacteroidales bacterium]
RREAAQQLIDLRISHFHPADTPRRTREGATVPSALDYRANVLNTKAEAFYHRHGAQQVERGLEQTGDYDGKALMTTRYCLRYELGCCLQGKNENEKRRNETVEIKPGDTLLLRNQERLFRLEFDCRECLMRICKA